MNFSYKSSCACGAQLSMKIGYTQVTGVPPVGPKHENNGFGLCSLSENVIAKG